jgi:hypothetical protein
MYHESISMVTSDGLFVIMVQALHELFALFPLSLQLKFHILLTFVIIYGYKLSHSLLAITKELEQ